MRAVAHDQSVTALVALTGELGDVGLNLSLQRLSQHPAGTLTHDLIDHRRRAAGCIGRGPLVTAVGLLGHYAEHGSYLPDRR